MASFSIEPEALRRAGVLLVDLGQRQRQATRVVGPASPSIYGPVAEGDAGRRIADLTESVQAMMLSLAAASSDLGDRLVQTAARYGAADEQAEVESRQSWS